MAPSDSFSEQLIRGSAWMIAMRWALRLVGLVSTAILARLLLPVDFGIVAMASVVAGLLETASYAGVDLALIRESASTRDYRDSAWTIQVIQGAIVAVLLLLSAPLVAFYFNEPRVAVVIKWLALKAFVDGFQNIGVVSFLMELNFAKEFRFNLYSKLLNLSIVVAAAVIFHNYLALVIGLVSGSFINVTLSYVMQPYRPSFSTTRIRHLWSFSNWLLISRVGSFLSRKSDQFIVGGAIGTAALGNYHVATELSTMPTTELVMPLRRALFPTLSRLQNNPAEFRSATLRTFSALAIWCFSIGFGLMMTANELVPIVLGPRWNEAIPLVQWLALYGAFAALTSVLEVPIWVQGKTRASATQSWLELLALVPLMIWSVREYGIHGAALSRVLVAVCMLPLMLYFTAHVCPIKYRDLLGALWRPLVAGLAMMGALLFPIAYPEALLVALAVKVGIGCSVYLAVLVMLWLLAGRPDGIEAALLSRARVVSATMFRAR